MKLKQKLAIIAVFGMVSMGSMQAQADMGYDLSMRLKCLVDRTPVCVVAGY